MLQEVNGSDLIVFSAACPQIGESSVNTPGSPRAQLWLQHWTDLRQIQEMKVSERDLTDRFEEIYLVPCIAVDINGRTSWD